MRPVTWWCEMPRAEGKWLTGPDGPLASGPGGATWAAGVLTLTAAAFAHLEHLGTIGDGDGRITREGEIPVLHAGGGRYELVLARGRTHAGGTRHGGAGGPAR